MLGKITSQMMHRRKSLELIAGLSPFILLSSNPLESKKLDSSEWLKNFKVRWNNSQTYCFEVFDAMPLSDFNFKPNPDIMSFGHLFTHIGSGLNGFAGVLDGSDTGNEPEPNNRTEVSDYLHNAFTHFNNALDKIILEDLYAIKHAKADVEPWRDFSTFDIITLGYNHTIHHIAQATVIIWLKNIVPPKYRF